MSEAVVIPIGGVIRNTCDAELGSLPSSTVTKGMYRASNGLPMGAPPRGDRDAERPVIDYTELVSGIMDGTERDPLTFLDGKLLQHFGVEHPDEVWFELANETIVEGSENISKVGRAQKKGIVAAREFLLHDLLDIDEQSYDSLVHKFPNLVPLDSFMGTNRLLFGMGVRVARRLHKINYGPEKTREKINFAAAIGLDPKRMAGIDISVFGSSTIAVEAAVEDVEEEGFERTVLNRSPQLIGYSHARRVEVLREMHGAHGPRAEAVVPAFPIRLVSDRNREEIRIAAVQHVIDTVGWAFSAWELVDKQPQIASLASANLVAKAHVIAACSDRQIPMSRVVRLMTMSTDDLLLAAASGVSPLTAKSVSKALADIPQEEKRGKALEILEQSDFTDIFGTEAKQALKRYYYAEDLSSGVK